MLSDGEGCQLVVVSVSRGIGTSQGAGNMNASSSMEIDSSYSNNGASTLEVNGIGNAASTNNNVSALAMQSNGSVQSSFATNSQ